MRGADVNFLRTRLVSTEEFWKAKVRLGAIYFVRDIQADTIKVGYSADPWSRLSNLQVGNSNTLKIIGLVAAPREVEPVVHNQLYEGRLRGEWFWDRGVTTQWLMDMTQGEPLCRHVWELVPAKEFFRAEVA